MQFQKYIFIFKCKVLKIESVGSLQQEIILEWPNYACFTLFTKEWKLCSHMIHFNSQKCKQCHAQLARGAAKVSLRKVRSVKCAEI